MMKFIKTKDIKYDGRLFRGRQIIGTEETLKLIYPLIGKAIFTWGWRSKEEQAQMVKKGASKTMDSNHRRGVAYDIWNWKDCQSDMRRLGFINDLSWDPGHFPLGGENAARAKYKIIDNLPNKLEELIINNTNMTSEKFVKKLGELIGKNIGGRIDDKDESIILLKVQEIKNKLKSLEEKNKNQSDMLNNYSAKIKSLEEKNKELSSSSSDAIGVLKALQLAVKALINFKF